MIRKVDRNGIANHLISIIHLFIYELEVIRKTLDTGNLSHGHSSIQMLFPFNKFL